MIKRGDICYYNFTGSGNVERGNRPCLVISNNKANVYGPIATVLPITSQGKSSLPTHVPIMLFNKSYILIEQITTVNKVELHKTCYKCSDYVMNQVEAAISVQMDLPINDNNLLKNELKYYKSQLLQYKQMLNEIETKDELEINNKVLVKDM